jgi:hypothetical protein
MSEKVKVNGITVAFPDGSTKELSIEHAKELYSQLNELFGSKVVLPSYPVVIEREVWPRWGQPMWVSEPSRTVEPPVWCSSSSSM